MVTTAQPPASSPPSVLGEQRVTLQDVTWQGYQDILQALPETRAARLTFDDGKLEIVMPLELHEQGCELIGLFIRILVVEMGLKLKSIRSTRLERDDLNRGAEPDNAYYIQHQPQVAGRTIDLANDPPPDLVVEVDISHTDIDKNRFYASMGVPEFWRFDGQTWQILTLDGDAYTEVDQSPTFPIIEKADLYAFLEQAYLDEVEAEIDFRQQVRQRLAT
ncbi:Uma2 family endonuclease [filamentous cyanobacterium LEGE 11480]|uniref:Uma2 family endonuclease n=1 Tax=Romeriopsis navalis LEGE 11480 TaxID=2777977 RepID=A0A928VLA8_9CYAN|nr:Uma2 family endonuclease [Romeriopsis navalis]MBE9030651.1 Uma2 family endonuclease [Romeriopsis navalis LEGE 11480]